MTTKISIAMATYNGEKYLQEQLDSFVTQTCQPDELVVCDDGSTDATLEILEVFRQHVSFTVRIYRNEINFGHIKNFEKALSFCTGDIIFLSDQDDVWFKNKIKTIKQIFTINDDIMVVINDAIITDSDLNPTQFTKLKNTFNAGFPESWFITGCCTAIRTCWLQVVLPIPISSGGHDIWINTLSDKAQARTVFKYPLQFYRRHLNNVSQALTSSGKGVSLIDIFLFYHRYGFKDARRGWRKEAEILFEYIQRLKKVKIFFKNDKINFNIEKSVSILENKITALEQRTVIVTKARWNRLPGLLRFYFSGGYKNFHGWKSLFKDILR